MVFVFAEPPPQRIPRKESFGHSENLFDGEPFQIRKVWYFMERLLALKGEDSDEKEKTTIWS
jgi:hypothetical protein